MKSETDENFEGVSSVVLVTDNKTHRNRFVILVRVSGMASKISPTILRILHGIFL